MKVQILILALVCLLPASQAYWSVPLDHVQILENKNGQTGVELDDAHYSTVNYITESNEHPFKTALDMTTRYNWATSKTCVSEQDHDACPTDNLLNCDSEPCTGKSTNSEPQSTFILGGRGNLQDCDEGDDDIKMDDVTFKDVPMIFPQHIDAMLCEYEAQDAIGRAGLGLGYTNDVDKHPNFLSHVKSSLRDVDSERFSFYFDGSIDQIIFGEPENYFASEDFTSYDNKGTGSAATGQDQNDADSNASNIWSLQVKTLTLGNAIDITFQSAMTEAIFDSTTKYIWTPSAAGSPNAEQEDNNSTDHPNDIMDEIMEKLNINHGAQCAKDPEDNLYHCICNKQFDDINFGFGSHSESNKVYALHMEDYVEYHDKDSNQKNCNLLFRPARSFRIQGSNSNEPTKFLPKRSCDERAFYLGTAFLKTIYVVFDQDNNNISLADSFEVAPTILKVDEATRITTIVLGIFIILITLGILLSILKKVPVQQVATVQTVTTTLPYVIQTPIVPQQVVQASPVRYAPNISQAYLK